jgi:D-tyrosyl-tRNA(Tyr) deacylase
MSATLRQEQLDVLVEVSRRIQACAEAGDWEAVNHLQEKSQQLAGELFAETIPAVDVQAVTEAVNEVLKINKCVMGMGVAAREVCFDEVGQLQQSRRAVKEYSSNTG